VKTQTTRQTVEVRADAEGIVSHAGAHLLAELVDRLGLTAALSAAMAQEALFGPVASERTAHRVIKSIDADLQEAIRGARAAARERAWDADARPETITLSIDATLLGAASEKEGAAGNYKGGFGFHPLLCYLDETGEPLAGLLRPGNAGANTARRSLRGPATGARAASRCRPRSRDPCAHRHRRAHPRLHAGLPRSRHPLLGRLRGRRAGARGDSADTGRHGRPRSTPRAPSARAPGSPS